MNNRNNKHNKPNKRRNRHTGKKVDLSNNDISTQIDDTDLLNRKMNRLESSNVNKRPTLDLSNILYNEPNITPEVTADKMNNTANTPNKLSTFLNNEIAPVKLSRNINNAHNDILLDEILNQTMDEFYKHYSSPFFSGFLPDLPMLENSLPPLEKEIIVKEQIAIRTTIHNLTELIDLCDKYPLHDNVEYNINMKSLHTIKPSLVELQSMIGMNSIKDSIVDQILYFIQDLHSVSPNNSDYMHAVICGPPGTGKTEVAKIMGHIFSKLGILKNNVFKKVTRDDLVAGYLGQTAIKTKDVIKECIGGVLFIDEAYALGNSEKRDSFSKECIDTLCEALSDNKKDLMCIIAGYEQELKDCFFSYNPGLESRFTWKFRIDDYSPHELRLIFEKKITDSGWGFKEPLSDKWFDKNKDCFTFFGRDMETLFSKVKIAHSRRVFCLPKEERTFISNVDLETGFNTYLEMGESQKRRDDKERVRQVYNSLYC